MTELSKQARDLGEWVVYADCESTEAARLIDDAINEARQGVLAIAKERAEYADKCRREAERQGCRAVKAEAERDELRATVERVKYLADVLVEQGEDHVEGCEGQPDCAACVRSGLIDALRGER